MQGRLSPPEAGLFQSFPRSNWADEFPRAKEAKLAGIEWIFDVYGEGINPIETPEGRVTLVKMLENNGLSVKSVCADYFMERHLVERNTDARVGARRLQRLITACAEIGINRIVLPFVDSSRIVDSTHKSRVIAALSDVVSVALESKVELHIESDMNPRDLRGFMNELASPVFKVNYDSGNSAALGYSPFEEFSMYGDRIGSFHVKDRKLGGGTVPLGLGDTDFRSLYSALNDYRYSGDFVLQVARGADGDEVAWIKRCRAAVVAWLRGEVVKPTCLDVV